MSKYMGIFMMKKCFGAGIIVLLMVSLPGALLAAEMPQLPDTASLSVVLGTVDVTAIKSSGRDLSGAPEAVTSIGRAQVERLNILALKDAAALVPNFYLPDYGTRMTSSIYVRGLGARIDQPVIGLNVDNVAYLNKDSYDFDLPDITRIEVMRGPQSTLYGRNTMGGVVNVHTLSPLEWQGLRAMLTLTAPFGLKASAAYYGRLSSTLGMSLSASFNRTTGSHFNEYNHSRIGNETAGSLRWKTAWRPSSRLTVENVAALQLNEQNGYPYALAGTGRVEYGDTCFYHRIGFTDGLTVSFTPSASFSLSSITGVQHLADNMTLDNDFLPDDYFVMSQRRHEWAATQDFVLKGKAARGRYRWLAGLFGFIRTSHTLAPVTFGDYGISSLIEDHRNPYNPDYPIRWDERTFTLASDFSAPSRGCALYHESAFDAGAFTFTAALRLEYEHPSLTFHNTCATSYTTYDLTGATPTVYSHNPVDINQHGHLSHSYTQLLPRLTASWRIPRSHGTLYANVAKGYKAGGFNTQMFSDVLQQELMGLMGISNRYDVDRILSYRPEWSWNYEAGAHLTFPSIGLKADLALFFIDCHDQQLTVFPEGSTTGRLMTNAGRTRSYGAEAALAWTPTPRWRADASWGFTDARFTSYDNGRQDLSGKQVPYAPANTLWLSLRHYFPLHHPTLTALEATLNARGVGPIWWDEENTLRQPFYILPGATLTLHANRWDLEAWTTNFTDTRYDVFSFVSIGHRFVQRGPGWRAGLTLRLSLL